MKASNSKDATIDVGVALDINVDVVLDMDVDIVSEESSFNNIAVGPIFIIQWAQKPLQCLAVLEWL